LIKILERDVSKRYWHLRVTGDTFEELINLMEENKK